MRMLTLWLYLISLSPVSSNIIQVYLNSHLHCDKKFEVTKETTYRVRADVSPDTETSTFRDCEVVFHAQNADGQLCIVQEGELSTIKDSNVELEVHDGYGDDSEKIFTLKYYPSLWNVREHCTQSSYITLYLRRINKNTKVNIQNILINFHIIDIESEDRKLYMDDTEYCSYTYHLQNSLVSVYNRQKEVKPVPKCGLKFEKEAGRNTSICLLYTPKENVKHSKHWQLSVSKEFQLNPQYFIYQLKWKDDKARENHAWCADGSIDSFVLVFERTEENWLEEPVEMFKVIVTDYSGTEESLLRSIRPDDNNNWHVYVIIAAVLLLVLVGVLFGIYIKKNNLFKMFGEYTRAHNPAGKGSKKSEFCL